MIKHPFKILLIVILNVMLYSCVTVKKNYLFIDSNTPNADTVFYASSEIYNDLLTTEGWFTQQPECITVETSKKAAYSGNEGLIIKWDRQVAGCPWLGMGFGWDGWNAKDLSDIKNTAALQFWVRLPDGYKSISATTTLPFAIGLEAYDGTQAWLGMSENVIEADEISTEWTKIVFPLSEFNWFEQDADISSIKQVIFNFEGNGEVYLDEIKIAPYHGGYRERGFLTKIGPEQFQVDGKMDDPIWKLPEMQFGNNIVHLAQLDSFLCIALEVFDITPLINDYQGDEIYKGDAFEIAFSTKPDANNRRTNLLTSDQHIGFALGDQIRVWDWRKHRLLTKGKTFSRKTATGYIVEAMINLNELNVNEFVIGELYGLEMAVDLGGIDGRLEQVRWNSSDNAGFDKNPSQWGEMLVLPYVRSEIQVTELEVIDIE